MNLIKIYVAQIQQQSQTITLTEYKSKVKLYSIIGGATVGHLT